MLQDKPGFNDGSIYCTMGKKTTKHLDDISMAFFVVVKFSLLFQIVVCCLYAAQFLVLYE